MRNRSFSAFFVMVGWGVTLLTPMVYASLEPWIVRGPDLPYLLSSTQNTDVRSSPVAFLIVVGVAIMGAAIAECAKLVSPSRALIVAVFTFQLALVVDCVRAYASDWWSYFFIVGTGRTVEAMTSMEPPPISAVTWPWISGGVAVLLASAAMLPLPRRQPDN